MRSGNRRLYKGHERRTHPAHRGPKIAQALILVHESLFSLDDASYHNIFPPNYLPASHTSAEQVGEVGAAANAKQVVLSHYGPIGLPDSQWQDAIGKNYKGKVTIARDGQVFAL
jgi:ribonuclease BN (tRNA processing enzyme)